MQIRLTSKNAFSVMTLMSLMTLQKMYDRSMFIDEGRDSKSLKKPKTISNVIQDSVPWMSLSFL
jgi:hypothetical protein